MRSFHRSAAPVLVTTLLTLSALGAQGCARRSHGRPVTESRNASEFTSVVAKGSADVIVHVGPATSVDVRCDDASDAAHLHTRVDGGALVIETDDRGIGWHDEGSCTVTVNMPKLEAVSLRGSGDLKVDGSGEGLARVALAGSGDVAIDSARAGRFEVSVEGSGGVTIRELAADDVAAKVTGSGDLRTSGKTRALRVESRGSGNIDARTLKAEDVSVRSQGSSEVRLYASRSAEVEASGSGDVRVLGHPQDRRASVHGSGSVRWE